jgi:hypothetical protein
MQIGAPMVRVLEEGFIKITENGQALVAANRALLRNDQLARLEEHWWKRRELASTLSLAEGHLSA